MTLNELIPNKVSCGEFQVYLKLATTQQSGVISRKLQLVKSMFSGVKKAMKSSENK